MANATPPPSVEPPKRGARRWTPEMDVRFCEILAETAQASEDGKPNWDKSLTDKTLPRLEHASDTKKMHKEHFYALEKSFRRIHKRAAETFDELLEWVMERTAAKDDTPPSKKKRTQRKFLIQDESEELEEKVGGNEDVIQVDEETGDSASQTVQNKRKSSSSTTTSSSSSLSERTEAVRKFLLSEVAREHFEVIPSAAAAAALGVASMEAPQQPVENHLKQLLEGTLVLRVARALSRLQLVHGDLLSMLKASPCKDLVPHYVEYLPADNPEAIVCLLRDLRKPLFLYPLQLDTDVGEAEIRFNNVVSTLKDWTFLLYAKDEQHQCESILKLATTAEKIVYEICAPEGTIIVRNNSTKTRLVERSGIIQIPHSLTINLLKCECLLTLRLESPK